ARYRGRSSRTFESGPGAQRVFGHLVAGQQLDRHRLQLANPLVGADRLPDGEDADRWVALLDHVPEHVQVGVVGDARLADAPHRRAHGRLRAVDRLALAEVELVTRAAAGGALLAAELDPLRVLGALADVGDEPHRPAVIFESRVHARVALSLAGKPLMPADQERRGRVELD